MKFPTHAVLSTCTGRLMGDIGGVYEVVSYLVGRSVFTHELPMYSRPGAVAMKHAVPALPTKEDFEHVNCDNYKQVLAEWEGRLGTEVDLPDHLRDCLADDRSPFDTAREVMPNAKIITI